jgi:hypothetical protein
MYKKNTVDLSTFLQIGNLCIGLIAWLLYYYLGANEYVDIYTIYFTCIFSLQNVFMLSYEKRHRDPFLIILILVATLFYATRVLSLLYDPWSLVLLRYDFTARDFNYSFLFIIISNIAIFLGLTSARGKNVSRKIDYVRFKQSNPLIVSLILLAMIFCNYFFIMRFESLGRISSYIVGIFLSSHIVLLLTITYTLINYNYLSRIYKNILFLIFGMFIVTLSLFGSRSSFLTLFILTICAMLSCLGTIKVSARVLVITVLLLPLMIISFLVATYVRELRYDPKTVINIERIMFLKNFQIAGSGQEVRLILRPLLDRAGFLSYAADIIANGEEYRKVINFEYYFKSIIDNGLTPGFNVFDIPKAANALRYIYLGLKSNPTIEDVIDEYSSDMFTIYGEYYVLFGGYPALIFLFLFSYIFKRLYLAIRTKNLFSYYLYRSVILLVFYNWLNSFGMDWIVTELSSIIIPILFLKNFYIMRKRKKAFLRPYEEINAKIMIPEKFST